MPLELTSPAFEDTGFLPRKYAGNGEDVSPPLAWRGAPEGAKSFALTCDDPDAGGGRTHWIIFDIPSRLSELPEHVAPQDSLRDWVQDGIPARQGRNDLGKIGYSGPVPTKDQPHHYTFTLYALDCQLRLPPGCRKHDLLNAMQNHILETAQLVGRYNE